MEASSMNPDQTVQTVCNIGYISTPTEDIESRERV